MGTDHYLRSSAVNINMNEGVRKMCGFLLNATAKVHFVGCSYVYPDWVSPDGVHLIPEQIYPTVLEKMANALRPKEEV
jgi:hypothetical protein